MPIKTLDNIFEKDRNNPEFLEAYFSKIYKNIRKHDESGTALTKLLKES